MHTMTFPGALSDKLSSLYAEKFGGKNSGRYRVAAKALRDAAGRRRLNEDDVRDLTRAMFERTYVLIDMDSFLVVISANSFVNHRRANDHCFEDMA